MHKTWKVIDLLKTTTEFFKQKQIENPRLNAEVLLAHVLKMSRVKMYVEFERPLSENELGLFRKYVTRRSKNEPLQYITGRTEFMGLPFEVNPSVLIPRPETEVLCEEIINLQENYKTSVNILDIGTGSGCIAISLAHFWEKAVVTAIDINSDTLETARENVFLNKTANVKLIEQDVFTLSASGNFAEKFEIIVSNPPYIAWNELLTLRKEITDFEPQHALTDFNDGLKFYRHIMDLVKNNILKCDYLFFEMSGSQPEKIVAEAKKCNFSHISLVKDLTGIERVLKLQK